MKHTDIKSVKQLANYLRCSNEFLDNAITNEFKVIDYRNEQSSKVIQTEFDVEKFYIKKKGKSSGYRTVYAIRTFQLANTLKILNNYLINIFTSDNSVHGFVPGRSIKTNATAHLAKKIILSVDIKDYFDTINMDMISKSLVQLGFDKEVAKWISNITTINEHLVQGFNTSPTIANIITDAMDKEFIKLCGKEITYTRYADDLYFSTNKLLPNFEKIENIINKYGFKLNPDKTKEMKRGCNQYVTGLTVFDNLHPRIPKRIKRNLRLEVYYIRKFGYKKHAVRRLKNQGLKISDTREFQVEIGQEIQDTQYRLFGWIHYIYSIETNVGNKLYSKLIGAKQ